MGSRRTSMKIHPFLNHDSPSINLSLGCKRLRPLAPKLAEPTSNFDLKSFIKTDTSPRNSAAISSSDIFERRQPSPQVVETSSAATTTTTTTTTTSCLVQGQGQGQGGTSRWNPTQEQIGILEMLYKGGMRTPNAQQIEQITLQLGKYGKIEGKNVFYWFQNHKARERQKQKRNTCLTPPPPPPSPFPAAAAAITYSTARLVDVIETPEAADGRYKMRKCSSWVFHHEVLEEKDDQFYDNNNNIDRGRTLDLFPLHPEGR